MKRLNILTSIFFTLGLATFAMGGSADNKDKQYGHGEYQKDQKGQSQSQSMSQPGQQFQQQKHNLVMVEHLKGAEVLNQQGEKIGKIDNVLVDVRTGQIGFVTLASGGTLGIGEEKYIVPFNALQKKMPQGIEAQSRERQLRFTLNKQKDQLKKVPAGDLEEALTQEGQNRGVFEHYGVSPYWENDQRQLQRQDDTQPQMMHDSNKDQQKNENKY